MEFQLVARAPTHRRPRHHDRRKARYRLGRLTRAEVVFGRAPIDWSQVGWLVAVLAATATVALWLALS